MDFYVTIINAKIFYSNTLQGLLSLVSGIQPNTALVKHVKMTANQFVRFKNAGKRHASKTPGKTANGISRSRPDRSTNTQLHKWDVDFYGNLTGRVAPWGTGAKTNRDHMTAHSSNLLASQNSGSSSSESQIKNNGIAITVSGKHHREASYTYGGRTKKDSPDVNYNRTQYGAYYPNKAFNLEMNEMLKHKFNRANAQGVKKLRLEMVGAYAFMYKLSVNKNVISASAQQDADMIVWLDAAVANDDAEAKLNNNLYIARQ